VDPSLFCGQCTYCQRRRGNLCEHWGATGDTVDGAFAELVSVPVGNAYAIPDFLSWGAAVLIEPLACVVHGLHRLAMEPGSELLAVGAGTLGLLLIQAARRSGAAQVSVIEPSAARRALAVGMGADVAVGAQIALSSLGRGGTMLVFGVTSPEVRLSVSPFQV
jgi:threonine dehydrogenase-like Zn-dependent dehydrogenase